MIVKNEELTLGRVLEAASTFCDELIVVDTGSTDRTIEIARQAGARVEHFDWVDDFAAARNYSFSFATKDWIFWLDADDVLPPETLAHGVKVKEVLDTLTCDIAFCPYIYAKASDGSQALKQSRERFLRRSSNPQWIGRVHEVINKAGEAFVMFPEFVVIHDTHADNMPRKQSRNIRIYEQYLDIETAPLRDLYLYGGELRAVGKFKKAIAVYQKYMEKWPLDTDDLFEEPYLVLVDMAESYRRIDNPRYAIETACRAIARNPERAEGYALVGLTMFELQRYRGAFANFLAAAACKEPTHGGLVYKAFYSDHIHAMITECKTKLDGTANSG
jgi:glycosyltransferase involved in cell wall biosynthesis